MLSHTQLNLSQQCQYNKKKDKNYKIFVTIVYFAIHFTMNARLPQVTSVYVSTISEFLNDEKHRIIYLKEFKYNIVQVFGILNTEVKNPSSPPPPKKKEKTQTLK